MDPALFKVFAEEFAAEWNRLQAEAGANLSRLRSERERVCRQIDRLVEALADGEPAARLKDKLRELERRRLELERELETVKGPAPRLHPNVAEAYRRKVEELHAALRVQPASSFEDSSRRSFSCPRTGGSRSRCAANWRGSFGFRGAQTKKLRLGGRSFWLSK